MIVCHSLAWSVAVYTCRMNTNQIRWRTDIQGGRRRVSRKKISSYFRSINWRNCICSILKTFIIVGWTVRISNYNRSRTVWPTQPPTQWVFGFFPGRKAVAAWTCPMTFHVEPRLRMIGTVLLLPLYVFAAWTGETSPLHCLLHVFVIFYTK
jgi:hypothetical protein